MLCSWFAQAHVSIHSCDFTNGYFQGQEIDRILLFRIPAEGIPQEGIAGGEILASRVPVYGTKDAGRGLWLRLENTCRQFNFSLNQILPTLFTLRDDESRILAVMSSNVDDLLYGYLPQAEAMNSVFRRFLVGKEKHGAFRFCGKEFRQDEDFGLHVTAKDNTEQAQPITHDVKHGLTRMATADEIHQLRSVTQSLAWISRQTRPDLSYRIPKIQSTFEKCMCSRLARMQSYCRICNICIHAWHLFSPNFLGMMQPLQRLATPVSVKNRIEQDQLDGVTQNFKSQQACITALAPGNALNAEKMLIHPLSWSSTRIRRVCRRTLMAEAYALSNAVEHGFRTRATLVDMRGQLTICEWEETASAAMGHVWFTDCESIFAHLIS